MKDTEALLRALSSDPVVARPMPSPPHQAALLLATCVLSGALAQWLLGLRPDLALRMVDFWYGAETCCLLLLMLSSLMASVLLMYPDSHQRRGFVRVPYGVFVLLAMVCIVQLLQQPSWHAQDATDVHGLTCSFSIAAVAAPPAMLVARLLARGAVVHPMQAGGIAVLVGSSLGCLIVRLHEAQDSMVHVVVWHYLPVVLMSVVGAWLGRHLLKW